MKVLPTLGAVAACVFAIGACGSETAPAPAPSQGAPAPSAPTSCGTVSVTEGSAAAFVREGTTGCDEAKSLLTQYFAKLTPADLASPGGAGPIALGSWTCGSDAGTPLSATCSTEDNRQIATTPG